MNLLRLYHTLRPLRPVQWTDRLLRPVKAAFLREKLPSARHFEAAIALSPFPLPRFITSDSFSPRTGEASFLNIQHQFDSHSIDWKYDGHGKLWAYHLNYFGWLDRLEDAEIVESVLHDFCNRTDISGVGAEPYPSSRRVQHWIAALLRWNIRDEQILTRLYSDAWQIARLAERHLQANHLLQNALAIFAAAHFFEEEALYNCSRAILIDELSSQFLADGAHVERSASYTADLCARFLWCLHLQRHSKRFPDDVLTVRLRMATAGMLAWLHAYAYSDDSLAAIGDSSADMMPALKMIREAGDILEVGWELRPLRESGYRKAVGKSWEAVINAGAPGPPYQPGHSHADALTFCLHAHGRPLVADVGVSTYERNDRRLWERSTEAHNTVVVAGQNSSDVWSSFRVGRRAQVNILSEDSSSLAAVQNGYVHLGVRHIRKFNWSSPNVLLISDLLDGRSSPPAVSFLHFHPDVSLQQTGENTWQAGKCSIHFQGFANIIAEPYQWAAGFNLLCPASRLRCVWSAGKTEIGFHF